jgi:molybdopterin/thiamine biosynthesis adenylyltransferase
MLERERYIRQTILPEVGEEGQAKLKAAQVIIIGMGGLGAPVAMYLAASGVGSLTLVDDDRVSLHNLQRQVLYEEADVGRLKVEAARDRLLEMNHHTTIHAHAVRLEDGNAPALLKNAQLAIDATDCMATRAVLNRGCLGAGIPMIFGAVGGYEAQMAVFGGHDDAPCFGCYVPTGKNFAAIRCAETGVLGPLTGIVGTMQAMEALKLILGIGEPMKGRLWRYNALTGESRTGRIIKDTHCLVCR